MRRKEVSRPMPADPLARARQRAGLQAFPAAAWAPRHRNHLAAGSPGEGCRDRPAALDLTPDLRSPLEPAWLLEVQTGELRPGASGEIRRQVGASRKRKATESPPEKTRSPERRIRLEPAWSQKAGSTARCARDRENTCPTIRYLPALSQ